MSTNSSTTLKGPKARTARPIEHIFVYGTLRNKARAKERLLLAEHGKRIGLGYVRNASLFLGEYPYAVPDRANGNRLVGEVYRLNERSREEVLSRLDEYEEFDPNNVAGSLYRREPIKVHLGEDEINAWIYWYNGPVANIPHLRHGNYLRSQIHVVPNGSEWMVKLAGGNQAELVTTNKSEAVKKARVMADKRKLILVVHGRDGRIKERIEPR